MGFYLFSSSITKLRAFFILTPLPRTEFCLLFFYFRHRCNLKKNDTASNVSSFRSILTPSLPPSLPPLFPPFLSPSPLLLPPPSYLRPFLSSLFPPPLSFMPPPPSPFSPAELFFSQTGCDDASFFRVFTNALEAAVEGFQPEALVLLAGADTLSSDPLGPFNLTSAGIRACVERVVALEIPLLMLGGGGYCPT